LNIKLIAHTQLTEEFKKEIQLIDFVINDKAAVALTAIRTCYSPNKPSEIVKLEGKKYFGNKASDGKGGTEADRLFRRITGSGHTSTLEHINYTFAIEGVSRALLAQLTRHRHLSFSVQSQRYVRLGSNDKSGGFEHVVPRSIDENTEAYRIYEVALNDLQGVYDELRECGVPAEDARMVLPNASITNIVMSGNLRTLLDFYTKRKPGKGAQYEITQLAEGIKSSILEIDPWLEKYFE
jgi:thymidylate synthase (FAD)